MDESENNLTGKNGQRQNVPHNPEHSEKIMQNISQESVNAKSQSENPENMEVHPHPDSHGKKPWKAYFFEFFMLFLAVFCGFLAEYQLEHKLERDREKQFIISMVKELQEDLVQIDKVRKDTNKYKNLDTLAMILLESDRSSEEIKKTYELYFLHTSTIVYMSFNRNTLTQLKNAGNMRLIRKINVVDSLNQLDNKITELNTQWEFYMKIMYDNLKLGSRIFDMGYLMKDKEGKRMRSKDEFNKIPGKFDFITNDKATFIEFGNMMKMQANILLAYHFVLKDYRKYSVRLIAFLKKEYHLENAL
jgi:hypothetical protein